jgi:uncharacterized protein Yka (UPF0111/DUF47 family)
LLPRDEKFFDLLIEQAKIVSTATHLFADSLGNGTVHLDSRALSERVRELEAQGDRALRNIYRRLHKSFITSIDPEDIHHLATMIDERFSIILMQQRIVLTPTGWLNITSR